MMQVKEGAGASETVWNFAVIRRGTVYLSVGVKA